MRWNRHFGYCRIEPWYRVVFTRQRCHVGATGPTLRLQVRRELFSYLQGHSQRYFLSHFAGALANRISEVALGVANTIWTVLFDFWPLIITFTVSLVLLMGVNLQLALTLGLWIAMYVLVSFFSAAMPAVCAKIRCSEKSGQWQDC